MSEARLLIGDVFERMAELEDGSVDLVLTSPPFLALRSYLPADHPDKSKEIGSEPTPAAFLDTLLALTAEWRRLLAPHGSICVELGDTYAGGNVSGGERSDGGRFPSGYLNADGRTTPQAENYAAHEVRPPKGSTGWPLPKSLCGIPHLYHLSLAYGRNLLTGEPSPAGSWRVRNVVAWCRPNPPVGALGDKFRPGTSYMTVACVSGARYFDLDAVRTATSSNTHAHGPKWNDGNPIVANQVTGARADDGAVPYNGGNPAGAPPLDWWEIPTQPYAGAHYATWPMALCERPIKAMVPQRVCTTCGEPSRRIVGEAEYHQSPGAHAGRAEHKDLTGPLSWKSGVAEGKGQRSNATDGGRMRVVPTLGWSDCGHDSWRTGLVLDPFAGSGTTLAAATGHGRDAIGIDLDPRNADLARERVGMFLTTDHGATDVVA